MFKITENGEFNEMIFASSYPLHKAARDGDIRTVNIILGSNPNLIVVEDSFKNWTPLHWASYFGKLDCVRQIVSVEPRLLNMQSSKNFQTAIHCSAEAGHPHCLLWQLQAGANAEVKDCQGEIALHKAARRGNAECVSLLIASSSNLSCLNSNGQTAATLAELCGHPAIASFIRSHTSSFDPLHFATPSNGIVPQVARLSRKRTHDMMNIDSLKRFRKNDLNVCDIPLPQVINNFASQETMSVIEHEKMRTMEIGYSNSFLDYMLSESLGC
ncbi:ankyrin repeat domain-containing protein 10-like [Uloborus diversus]|uniref:ankyrin repeat domain-containing protein 10-like n=1 Tax=Uloborus diversus TaxID=327109 RepID=UPI00240979CF|nr:ankyrin repeat domain-containing protein 10-like [Uloborus diversus]